MLDHVGSWATRMCQGAEALRLGRWVQPSCSALAMEPLIAAMVCFQTKGRTHDRRAQLAALGGLAVVLAPQTSHTRSISQWNAEGPAPRDPIGSHWVLDSVGFCWILLDAGGIDRSLQMPNEICYRPLGHEETAARRSTP